MSKSRVGVGVGAGPGPKKRLWLQPKRAAPATLPITNLAFHAHLAVGTLPLVVGHILDQIQVEA